jgi:hypothetical protein
VKFDVRLIINRLRLYAANCVTWFTNGLRFCVQHLRNFTIRKSGGRAISSGKRVWFWVLYLLLILGSLYRIDYIIEFNPMNEIWSDPQRHWEQGVEVLRTDPMTMTDPILYQLYMGAIGKLTVKLPELAAFYTIILSLVMPWFWYRFFRELQPSRLIAVAGWVVITWLPSWNSIYGYFMQETLMLPLMGASLWLTWRCRRRQTVKSFTMMVFIWVLAGLTRSVCIPLAAVATTWVWFQQRHKFQNAVNTVLILTLILGPLTYRSYQMMHILAPHGIVQMNTIYARSGKQEVNIHYYRDGAYWVFGYMSPALLIEPLEPLSHWRTQREGIVHAHVSVENGYNDWNVALEQNPLTLENYFWIVKENLIFLFFAESWPDSNRERLLGEINYQMRWIWAPLLLICLIGFVFCYRSQRKHLLLPALLLTWFIIQGLAVFVVNEGRYRKPGEGLLIAELVLLAGTCRRRRSELPGIRPVSTRRATDKPERVREQYWRYQPTRSRLLMPRQRTLSRQLQDPTPPSQRGKPPKK